MIVFSVLLTILKWLGIIIIGIIGLIILLCLLILFTPIKYSIKASYNNNELEAKANASYIFRIIKFKFNYNSKINNLTYKFKILFFNIINSESIDKNVENKSNNKSKKHKDKKPNIEVNDLINDNINSKDSTINDKISNETNNTDLINNDSNNNKIDNNIKLDISNNKLEINSNNDKTDSKQSELINDKNNSSESTNKFIKFIKKIYNKIKNKKYTLSVQYDKIKKRYYRFIEFKDFLTSNVTKNALNFIKTELKKFFNKIAPKKWDLNIEYGLEDRALTGQILGAIAYMYPKFPGKLNVKPYFDDKLFRFETTIKGKIYPITILIIAIKFYRNKDIRKVYKRFKKS